MRISLDTNICIALMRGKVPHVRERFQRFGIGDLAMSAIVYSELATGVEKSRHPTQQAYTLAQLVARVPVLAFSQADAAEAGRVRASLEQRGLSIGPLDTLIAGQALARGLTLATNNVREFSRVKGLAIEDWLAPL